MGVVSESRVRLMKETSNTIHIQQHRAGIHRAFVRVCIYVCVNV